MITACSLEYYSIVKYISLLAMTSLTVVCGNGYENGGNWHTFVNGEDDSASVHGTWWNPAFHITLIPSKVEHLPVAQNRIVFINCTNGHSLPPSLHSDTDDDAVAAVAPHGTMTDDASPSEDDTTNTTVSPHHSSPSVSFPASSGSSTNSSSIIPGSSQEMQHLRTSPPAQQQSQKSQTSEPYYIAIITSADSQVAIPTTASPHEKVFKLNENRTDQILLRFLPSEGSMFSVQAQHVGYGVLVVEFYDQHDTANLGDDAEFDQDPNYWNLTKPIYELYFSVSVVRKVRWVDMTFDCVIAAMATLNAFSIGCDSDWASLHQHLQKPATLLLATGCQMLINPLVSTTSFLPDQPATYLYLCSTHHPLPG